MSDLAVYAEALIATVARAFYDDETVMLIDVLVRDKFLRDDDMAPRLNLPAKRLRAQLQFLQDEHLVRSETVDDLAQGGSQATKFYYLDYNRAVHSLRLRLYLLRKRLEQAELRARSSSFYLCPGYKLRRCNGRYTEEEAQQVLNVETGLFLCQECQRNYENDPNAPSQDTYTLQLVDNTRELKLAVDNLRRLNVQLSAKSIGDHQIRAGVYDLLQKVRGKGKAPITSNLPSENFALGIGSQRLAGTGRTAGIKAKKLEQQGVAESAAQARKYLVGVGSGNGNRPDDDLMFLKNAMGHEIQFTVERGGGARAQLLATQRRRRRKLMEAAASRVGAAVPLHVQVEQDRQRRLQEEARAKEEKGNKKPEFGAPLEFLADNIGRNGAATVEDAEMGYANNEMEVVEEEEDQSEPELVLADDFEELGQLDQDQRHANFQAQYKMEVDRQAQLLNLFQSDQLSSNDGKRGSFVEDDERSLIWEDGDT